MSGFESNRFVDLSQSMERHLICSICLNVYNNAIKTDCEHTFCKSCLQDWIQDNHNNCPECRTGFTSRQRTTRMITDINVVIISNFVFRPNLMANNIINDLKIKCDFESNGCQKVIELGLLSTHLLKCEHRLCPKCDLLGSAEGHDCLELMKTERNQLKAKISLLQEVIEKLKTNINRDWIQKFNEMKDTNKRLEKELINKTNELKEMKEKEKTFKTLEVRDNKKLRDIESKLKSSEILNSKLEKQLNEIKAKNSLLESKIDSKKGLATHLKDEFNISVLTLSAKYICFGTLNTEFEEIRLNSIGFTFLITEPKIYQIFTIRFELINELKFCSDPSFPAIIFRTDSQSCDEIRKRIPLTEPSKGWFNVGSDDIFERYVVILLSAQTFNSEISYKLSLIFNTFIAKNNRKYIYSTIGLDEVSRMFNV